MSLPALILAAAAAFCFLVETAVDRLPATSPARRANFAAHGLLLLTAAWIVQSVTVHHPIHT